MFKQRMLTLYSAVQQSTTWWCKRTQEIKKLKPWNIVSSTTIEVKRKEYTICESFISFPPISTAQQEPTIVSENLICSIYAVYGYKANWNLKMKTKLTSNSLTLTWWLYKLLDYLGQKSSALSSLSSCLAYNSGRSIAQHS